MYRFPFIAPTVIGTDRKRAIAGAGPFLFLPDRYFQKCRKYVGIISKNIDEIHVIIDKMHKKFGELDFSPIFEVTYLCDQCCYKPQL